MRSVNVFYHKLEKDYQKIFKDIIKRIKTQYGWDLSYMKLQILDKCVNENNIIEHNKKSINCPGSYTTKKIIYIGSLQHIEKVKRHHNIRINTHKFLKQMIVHELMHEVYRKNLTPSQKKWYKDMLLQGGFVTPYLEKINNGDEEKFCEYIAHSLYG
ncbi:MAG: hypothetical protein ACOC2W_00740 [bacterium]